MSDSHLRPRPRQCLGNLWVYRATVICMLLMALAAAIGLFYLASIFMDSLAPDTRMFVDILSFFLIAFLIVVSACFMSRRWPE